MDPDRYNGLIQQNAALRDQVNRLEGEGASRNPTWTPPDLPSPDLMYGDAFAAAATQPAGGAFGESPLTSPQPDPDALRSHGYPDFAAAHGHSPGASLLRGLAWIGGAGLLLVGLLRLFGQRRAQSMAGIGRAPTAAPPLRRPGQRSPAQRPTPRQGPCTIRWA